MIRRFAALAVLAALTATFSFVNGATPSAARVLASEFSPVMLVLDSSGSMTARDAGGTGTRMDAAKRAVGSMVDGLPAEAQVGLTIYGAGTGSSGAEKAAGCRDVRVVRPVSTVNKPALKAAVTATKARGYTPIGQALRVAAGQLPKEGQRSIVLVSDGEDTCAPPQPCVVAKELARQGVDLHVHAIGFKVDAKARAQLACIAQSTGGTYHDATDRDSLLGVLGRVTDRALRHYEPVGKPVVGSNDPANAPVIEPGQYVDTLSPVEERFYSVELKTGDTAYFAATAIFPRGNPRDLEVLDIKITGPGAADCYHRERELNTRAGADGGSLTTVVTWNGLAPGASRPKACSVPGKYTFRITRDAEDGADRVPVELLVRIEPPVVGALGEPAQTSLVDFAQPPAGGVRAVRGGGSFNEATTLSGSGRFGETIYYGEELFYRVKLDWGQGLAYRVTYGGRADGETANIRTGLFTPVRAELKFDTTAYTGETKTLPSGGKPIATPRVVYLNRNANDSKLRRSSVDGWYYIIVRLGASVDSNPSGGGVPITIDLATAGEKVAGPEYGESGATGTSPTPTVTPTETDSPEPTQTPAGTTSGDPGQSGDESDSGSPLPWIIGGGVVLLAIAIIAAALLRRRPARAAGPHHPNQAYPTQPQHANQQHPQHPGQGQPGQYPGQPGSQNWPNQP